MCITRFDSLAVCLTDVVLCENGTARQDHSSRERVPHHVFVNRTSASFYDIN